MPKNQSPGSSSSRELPSRFRRFQEEFPDVSQAYEAFGAALRGAGPLNLKSAALVKLGIAVGARAEGAVHSHARRALDAGCSKDEIRHVALLAATTLGFPSMMAALSWIDDVVGGGAPGGDS